MSGSEETPNPMRQLFLLVFVAVLATLSAASFAQGAGVTFTVRSARTGKWSDPNTWAEKRLPKAGDYVQVRPGHTITYDVNSDQAIRMVHVAGTLTFARDKSTRLDVGLIKIQAGEEATEEGFDCDMHGAAPADDPKAPKPALEIGTRENPIPASVTATIRLVYFDGTNRETLPAILNCGGRWDIHGAPMSRTWLKLGATAKAGEATVTLAEPVTGWKAGDRVIVTASKHAYNGGTFRKAAGGPSGNTEERRITQIQGATLTLDNPLQYEHWGTGDYRSEVANLSRNVVVESADPAGVRGHTMFHVNSTGGISYAEFRHLGKEGVLGKYSIHFHLVRDSMRGSGVLGASIWDSRNRWLTIHGTDYLLVRDCVGYQSVGHGYFLEDGTEQYNVLDRNLAVQAYGGKRLPKQVLPFDPNDGAGFWWANGRNTLTRNVSCENDEYGFRFEIAKRSNFDPALLLRMPDGTTERRDVRTLPFYRFEGNESHTEGLYSFNFGDDVNPAVRGDRQHPFIARDLTAWQTHYSLRPNLQFFLMDGLKVNGAAYGVYHPDYDAHVYRNVYLARIGAEPINRGHDDDSIQYGSFTYDGLTIEECRVGRDPLIQLTCTSPSSGQAGHFRNVTLKNNVSRSAQVVDLGGGPRSSKLQNAVPYYFHDFPASGRTTKVVSAKFPDMMKDGDYRAVEGFTGKDVRAAELNSVPFPTLLEPVDDLPPATMVTGIRRIEGKLLVRGVSHDNGDLVSIVVNGRPAKILANSAGVADWEITLDPPRDGLVTARGTDKAGNAEKLVHAVKVN
jgi:G8 domain-containing protein